MTRHRTAPTRRLAAACVLGLALVTGGCNTLGTLIRDVPVGEMGVVVKNGMEEYVDWEYVGASREAASPQRANDMYRAAVSEFLPVPHVVVRDRACTMNDMVAYIDGVEIDRTPPGYCTGDVWIIDGQPGEPEGSGPSATHLVPDQDAIAP